MPGDFLTIFWHFTEKVRAPSNHVFTQQIPDTGRDLGVGEDIPHASIFQMCGTDRVTITTRRNDLLQEIVKILTNAGNLRIRIDANSFDIPFAIELIDLLERQNSRRLGLDVMKTEIARYLR